MKKGFTLIELLVVIGIIGILSGVLLSTFKDSTESARMAKCKVHLRQLAQASTAKAMTLTDKGKPSTYPLAGSYLKSERSKSVKANDRHRGWIGYSLSSSGNGCSPVPFYQDSGNNAGKSAYEVITNGLLWTWTKCNRALYTCPTYVNYRRNKGLREPMFTYVMNSYFWYDNTRGTGTSGTAQSTEEDAGIKANEIGNADRRIMFAELPFPNDKVSPEISDPEDTGDDYQCDCTLQASGKVGNISFEERWPGVAESIGFPHKIGKHGYCGNVVFCDCHTESIMYPEKSGGLTKEELTVLLCAGVDYAYANGQYSIAYAADDEDEEQE